MHEIHHHFGTNKIYLKYLLDVEMLVYKVILVYQTGLLFIKSLRLKRSETNAETHN